MDAETGLLQYEIPVDGETSLLQYEIPVDGDHQDYLPVPGLYWTVGLSWGG